MDRVSKEGSSEAAPRPLTLRFFGQFEAYVRGVPLPRLHTRKGQWLLALLVLRSLSEHGHPRPVDRTWLAGTLWPDSPESLAYGSLRTALADLRSALGAEAIRVSAPAPRTLTFDSSGAEIDVAAFDAAIAQADVASLEKAVALYRGPLLEGCEELWACEERQAREATYLGALERLAGHAMTAGDASMAECYLRRAITADPLRETAHRALMAALATQRKHAAVLEVYRELRLLLHRELNALPDAETRTLFEQLREEARTRRLVHPVESASRQRSDTPHHNLPLQRTRFIGRAPQIAEIAQLLEERRLVTLTGAGGGGKSRFSQELARRLLDRFPDGVWLVELAALHDTTLVAQQVAAVLGVKETPDRPVIARLIEALQARELLLLLDNCEHLVGACAVLADALLRECTGLKILATSREALNIPGEATYRLPTLSVPDLGHLPPLGRLAQNEAVDLFVDRAKAAASPFALTEQNAPTVAQVCARLDGIPLAIELAAARIRVLSVHQIAERLDDRFHLLTDGSRTALSHHQTLRALIDWSYDLLPISEQRLLARLSVFAGGWTLDAAEGICAGETLEQRAILGLLAQLVNKSLVIYEAAAGQERYQLLETIRQYALEKLGDLGEETALRNRHRDWFLMMSERAAPELGGREQVEWFTRLEREHENLRAAIAWSIKRDQGETGVRLGAALWRFWWACGYWREGREHLSSLLALPVADLCTTERARALTGAGILAGEQGEFEVARAHFEQGLEVRRALGDPLDITSSLLNLGNIALAQEDYEAAREAFEQSLTSFRQLGDQRGVGHALNNLGIVAQAQGDYGSARTLYEESLAIRRAQGDQYYIAGSLISLGALALKEEEHETAQALCRESLILNQELGAKPEIIASLERLAAIACAQGRLERAARLFGAAEAFCTGLRIPIPRLDRADYERWVAAVKTGLTEETYIAAWAEGRRMSLEQAIEYALEPAE